MHVGLVSTTYRPRHGGMETHVTSLAEHLAAAGHEVTVLTNRDSTDQPAVRWENGVRVLRGGALLQPPDPNAVPWERGLFAALDDFAPLWDAQVDVIHTHTQAALLLTHMSGLAETVPVVASFHETRPETEPGGLPRSRFVASRCTPTLVLAGSRAFARQAEGFGYPAERIRTVHLGVRHRPRVHDRRVARHFLAQAAGVPTDSLLIALTGRYTPRKAQHRLLDAFELMATRADCRVVLFGSTNGSDAAYLHQVTERAARHGDRVTLLSDQSDEVRDLLAEAADLVTQPSTAEGLGLAVIEFMQHGAPAVVSDIDGLNEVVTADSGRLVDTADPAAYAAALDELAALPTLRAHASRAAADRATRNFGMTRCVANTTAAYSEAINAARPVVGAARV
ncbi:glycosyltransferase family 4 protein [Kitasatospora sp. NPDC052868]|uniref:glycosyltransferase family 4 protein n=1 Tax=Streptomycetaceae TaxID=2062 RepID=UPI0006AFDFA9|nr:glycosyltransferase family 4 protein [Streptomyces sp. XY593]